MKIFKLTFLLTAFLIFHSSLGQDTYKKRYYVPEEVHYTSEAYKAKKNNRNTTLKLKVKDENCSTRTITKTVDGKKVTVIDTIPRNIDFDNININTKSKCWTKIILPKWGRLKANLKFENEYVYVNPWLLKDSNGKEIDRDKIYFFKLENRQSLKIGFRQWTLNALTVPLKIRWGEKETEFTTGANLGAFFGYTWGKTNFLHRKKIGNKQYDSKLTTGIFLGADELEFTFDNNEAEEVEVNSAFVSIGTGILYSYQKFTFGVTGGFDFALGDNRNKWKFDGRPWLGATLGYSLFSF